MSISEFQKQKLTEYLKEKGHTIIDNNTTIKTQCWKLLCRDCGEENSICVNNMTPLLNNNDDIRCKICRFQKKVSKFLDRCNVSLIGSGMVEESSCYIHCNNCHLSYNYTGDYQDRFKCYCKMTVRRSEHQLYKTLQWLLSDHHAMMSKEVRYFGNHKVDIMAKVDEKTFLFEVDDHGHYNPRTSQGLGDIECIKQFLKDDDENVYLVHITDDDVYNKKAMETLATWITKHLDDEPAEKMLLVDLSGKNRYKYLNLENQDIYTK